MMSSRAKVGAATIALVAFVTLATRLYLRTLQSDGMLDALLYMSQYFTILTNTITLVMMTWITFGRTISPRLVFAVVVAIVCVGLIYHSLLAHLVSLSGIDLWADHGTHTFVPLLAGVWWILLAPKAGFQTTDVILWVTWPLVYCIYILLRASSSGFYPYPFLNLPEIGWGGLLSSIAGLLVGFVVVGIVLNILGWLAGRFLKTDS